MKGKKIDGLTFGELSALRRGITYPGSNGYRGYFQRIDEAYLIPLSEKSLI